MKIRTLSTLDDACLAGLSEVLIDCVAGGASVSFMWPLDRGKAEAFWRQAAQGLASGERVIMVAEDDDGVIVGTVQLILAQPENQPHRADLAKMLVHRRARERGVGAQLLAAAEAQAVAAGKTLLVLDTASDAAERLYQRGGWQVCGRIPNYARLPDGRYCDTVVYYKTLSAASA